MINTNTQAILLLTSYFSKLAKSDLKPLSPTEWGRFARWLNEQGNTPADLVTGDLKAVISNWVDPKISQERIEQLLKRGHALALALEKWSRSGIWVLTRSDAEYPWLLKQRLRNDAPPVLFGCGNARLLNQSGVSVVGSRDATDLDLNYARELGRKLTDAGLSVVSGGARGIDEEAMQGALNNNGTVVGIVADSLLQAATASKWREGLMSSNLVLVSPFYPEAGFNAGNAMARNKYIYCLSQAAVVVHSGSKGGTWNGALENLKKNWVPLWVKETNDAGAGNNVLVTQGGRWISKYIDELDAKALAVRSSETFPRSFDVLPAGEESSKYETNSNVAVNEVSSGVRSQLIDSETSLSRFPAEEVGEKIDLLDLSFYELFLKKLERHRNPVTIDELIEKWGLPKSLVGLWVKQAIDQQRLKKLSNPVRYQYVAPSQLGLGLV
ncbi:hypothetical protein D3C85_703630 [compost metagenome]